MVTVVVSKMVTPKLMNVFAPMVVFTPYSIIMGGCTRHGPLAG